MIAGVAPLVQMGNFPSDCYSQLCTAIAIVLLLLVPCAFTVYQVRCYYGLLINHMGRLQAAGGAMSEEENQPLLRT